MAEKLLSDVKPRATLLADKAYDTADFVAACRQRNVTPHVAQNDGRRGGSTIDGRTTRHDGYRISQVIRKRIEEHFGWGKTIGRIFLRETGMGYQQWRQQWRLMRAMELLATGRSLSYCAFESGFASDSAFIAFFKSMTGSTPGRWLT